MDTSQRLARELFDVAADARLSAWQARAAAAESRATAEDSCAAASAACARAETLIAVSARLCRRAAESLFVAEADVRARAA